MKNDVSIKFDKWSLSLNENESKSMIESISTMNNKMSGLNAKSLSQMSELKNISWNQNV